MGRPKSEIEMTRKNVFISEQMCSAMAAISKEHGLSEADIIRGALAEWVDSYRRASQRLRNQKAQTAREHSGR